MNVEVLSFTVVLLTACRLLHVQLLLFYKTTFVVLYFGPLPLVSVQYC